jgi:uncharacterized protein YecT (DUF1311 family)
MKTPCSKILFVGVFLVTFACGWVCHASQAGKAMAEADANLNILYKKLLAKVHTSGQKEKLKTAQRAWVAWVEAEVVFQEELLMDGKAGLFARLEPTEARAKQFDELLQRTEDFNR